VAARFDVSGKAILKETQMNRLKTALAPKTLAMGALATIVAAGAFAASAPTASADVACNRWGDCWRVHDRTVVYPGGVGIVYHDDAWWDAHHPHRYHWRGDHDGRGYWRRGVWIGF
jgi:hypothetical protein